MEIKIFYEEITQDLLKLFAKELLQTCIFKPESYRGAFLAVLKRDDYDFLLPAAKTVAKISKKKLSAPLFLGEDYIASSLDSFPLEFLHMQSSYENLHCQQDLIKNLQFSKADVRLQMERELKSKWLLVRSALLENHTERKYLTELISVSINSLIPTLKGLLYLKDEKIPIFTKDIFPLCENITGFSLESMKKAWEIYQTNPKLTETQLGNFYTDYLTQIKTLLIYIDKF